MIEIKKGQKLRDIFTNKIEVATRDFVSNDYEVIHKNHRKPLSRYFPAYHPKAGQPTFFVEKVWSANVISERIDLAQLLAWNKKQIDNPKSELTKNVVVRMWDDSVIISSEFEAKPHTIRAGHNVKVGDTVQFYVWSRKPYASPQIVVTPKIEVKKVWRFHTEIYDNEMFAFVDDIIMPTSGAEVLANNDGLTLPDFEKWICKHPKLEKNIFDGQIICWNDSIEY